MIKPTPRTVLISLLTIAILTSVAVIGTTQALGGDDDGDSKAGENAERIRPLTPNERLELIAKENPGFGGRFRDPNDKSIVTVFMTDTSKREIAERAARASVSDPESIREVRIVKADFELIDLAEWYRQITKYMWADVDEITQTGISEETNRIKIRLSDMSARDKAIKVLNEHGIPVNAVRFEEGGFWELLSEDGVREEWRPVVEGVQIQTGGSSGQLCTSGFVAERNSTLGHVVNSHCTNNSKDIGGVDDMDIHQEFDPLFGDKIVAVEIVDPDPFTNATEDDCPLFEFCRWSDSAFAEKESGISFDLGHIAKPTVLGQLL